MRAALDTNVLLSGLLRGRSTRPVLSALIAQRFHLVISPILLEELLDVVSRPGWRHVIDRRDLGDLLAVIHEAAIVVTPRERLTVCRDPEDNALLECGITGQTEVIVTGDKDLLVLHPFRGIRILQPAEFLRLFS